MSTSSMAEASRGPLKHATGNIYLGIYRIKTFEESMDSASLSFSPGVGIS